MSLSLYNLINSLSTNEKVHFKRNAKVHVGKVGKNYLKLYHAYEKLKSYNKAALSQVFKGSTIEKYFSSEANYLKEKILISLFNFNLNQSPRNQIQKGIIMVEVLTAKGFRIEALKKLKLIKKKALLQEEFTWILRLIELEEIVLFKEGIIGYREQLELLTKQRNEVTSIIQNINNYHVLRQEVRELQFSEDLLANGVGKLDELYKNPLIANSQNCLSAKAKEHWYYIQVLMSYLRRDFEAGLIVSDEYVKFMYQNNYLFDYTKILPVLSNYIYHAALTKNSFHFENGEKYLEGLSQEKDISIYYVQYIRISRKLEFAYSTNDFALMNVNLELVCNLIEHESDHFEESQIQYLFMLLIRSTIVLKKYDQGMYYMNLWHRRGILPFRKVQARLFSIFINFDLKHFDLLQSELILLKKLERDNSREKSLVNIFYIFFNSMMKHPETKSKLIKTIQKELEVISKQNKGYFEFVSFNYYLWSLQLT